MDTFRATAFRLAMRDAIVAALGAVLLLALSDAGPATGFLIAANAALLFALILVTRAGRLTDGRIRRGQFWRALPAERRPAGEGGVRMARNALAETWLAFAKGAAGLAIILSALAYASHGVSASAWAKAARTPIMQIGSSKPAWNYRSPRVLPMN